MRGDGLQTFRLSITRCRRCRVEIATRSNSESRKVGKNDGNSTKVGGKPGEGNQAAIPGEQAATGDSGSFVGAL